MSKGAILPETLPSRLLPSPIPLGHQPPHLAHPHTHPHLYFDSGWHLNPHPYTHRPFLTTLIAPPRLTPRRPTPSFIVRPTSSLSLWISFHLFFLPLLFPLPCKCMCRLIPPPQINTLCTHYPLFVTKERHCHISTPFSDPSTWHRLRFNLRKIPPNPETFPLTEFFHLSPALKFFPAFPSSLYYDFIGGKGMMATTVWGSKRVVSFLIQIRHFAFDFDNHLLRQHKQEIWNNANPRHIRASN